MHAVSRLDDVTPHHRPTLFERPDPSIQALRDAVYDALSSYLGLGPSTLGGFGADEGYGARFLQLAETLFWHFK
jgi:hypothetical protein